MLICQAGTQRHGFADQRAQLVEVGAQSTARGRHPAIETVMSGEGLKVVIEP
jgi:hypothetical protein